MNRTYIEMMLDLADRGKTILPAKLYREAERIGYILYKNPELEEQVVQMRIKIYKEFNKYDGYHILQGYQKFIIDYAIICKLINRPCHILMPDRIGKTIFYKIMMNMWYGDMMMKEFGNMPRNEFLQKRFNMPPVEKE
jgi:hypothetical protein